MFRSIIIGTACALSLAASPAAAEPFETFVDFCFQSNVDQQAAATRAKAAGWVSVPAEATEPEETDFRDQAVFINIHPTDPADGSGSEEFDLLITGWGSGEDVFGLDGLRLDVCAVAISTGEHKALQDQFQTWVGVPQVLLSEESGEEGWVFSRDSAGFRDESALLDEEIETLSRVTAERKLYIAGVVAEDDMVILLLAAIRPAP